MNEPDTRILSVHDWSQHLITTIDKLLIECKDHPRAKALLLHHVQKRQQDTRIRERMRLIREVQATDVDAARKEIAGGANPGGKRKQRADSPLDEHIHKAEQQQPTKKQRVDLKSLSLGDKGQNTSSSNSNGARRPPAASGINALAPINTSDSAERPTTGANTRAREPFSTNGARHPLMDSSVSLLAPTPTASNNTEPPSVGSNLDTHPPSNEALQAFRRFRHKRSWVTELLAEDLDRIEATEKPKLRSSQRT
ncbi:uncharacterized protein J3D65DRAFT_640583 [Phyllosticta citribraziliensis]|uniref:Uncharacterized protein n=1 Tax=Phyllosticta citribraziliensis TaxID=989973 RepID=A0ABR1L4S3_9PEZI